MISVNDRMQKVYPANRYRWCEADVCGCVGCVNRSSGIRITKEEWEQWVKENPKPNGENR